MGRYGGCHMKHRAIKILETTLKWEMSFLPFLKTIFSGSEDELAKKVFLPKRSKVFSHLDAAAWQSGADCRSPGE